MPIRVDSPSVKLLSTNTQLINSPSRPSTTFSSKEEVNKFVKRTIDDNKNSQKLNLYFLNFATLYKEVGALDEAIKYATEYITLNKGDAKAYRFVGQLYKEKGRIREAIVYYKSSLAFNAKQEDLIIEVAELLLHRTTDITETELEELSVMLDSAFSMTKTNTKKDMSKLVELKAEVLSLKGRKREAVELILSTLKRDPSSVELHLKLLAIWSTMKEHYKIFEHLDAYEPFFMSKISWWEWKSEFLLQCLNTIYQYTPEATNTARHPIFELTSPRQVVPENFPSKYAILGNLLYSWDHLVDLSLQFRNLSEAADQCFLFHENLSKIEDNLFAEEKALGEQISPDIGALKADIEEFKHHLDRHFGVLLMHYAADTMDDPSKLSIASASRSFLQLAFTTPSPPEALVTLERLSEVGRLLHQLLSDFPALESGSEVVLPQSTDHLQQATVQAMAMATYVITKFHRFPPQFDSKEQILTKIADYDKTMILMDPLNLNKLASLGYWYLDKDINVIQHWIAELFVGLQHMKEKYRVQMGVPVITDMECFILNLMLQRKRKDDSGKAYYSYFESTEDQRRFWTSILYYQYLYQDSSRDYIHYNVAPFEGEEFQRQICTLKTIAQIIYSDIRNGQSTDPGSLFVLTEYLKQLPESTERSNRIASYYDIIVNKISRDADKTTLKQQLLTSGMEKINLKEDPLDTVYRKSHFALGQLAASHNNVDKAIYHYLQADTFDSLWNCGQLYLSQFHQQEYPVTTELSLLA